MGRYALFYDRHGEKIEVPAGVHETLSETDSPFHSLGFSGAGSEEELLTPSVVALIARQASMSHVDIAEAKTRKFAEGAYNVLYLLQLGASKEAIVRIASVETMNEFGRPWMHRKVHNEVGVLKLLRHYGLPVPEVHTSCCNLAPYPDCVSADSGQKRDANPGASGAPFMVIERVDGVSNEWPLHGMQEEEKLTLCRNFADFAVGLSKVPVPPDVGIGSVASVVFPADDPSEAPRISIGPFRGLPTPLHTGDAEAEVLRLTYGNPFHTEVDFLRSCVPVHSEPGAVPCLALAGIKDLIAFLRPSSDDLVSHRRVLAHLDLTLDNVLSSKGRITSIIDWEFAAILPLYIAADRPTWLRYEGPEDSDGFAPVSPPMALETMWVETKQESERYNRAFEARVAELDAEFLHAVKWGRPMRQLLLWFHCWIFEDWYVTAFEKWRKHVEGFRSLAELVESPMMNEGTKEYSEL